jgi:hypothetical protein
VGALCEAYSAAFPLSGDGGRKFGVGVGNASVGDADRA